jgi:PAS domain S-box-containing protein
MHSGDGTAGAVSILLVDDHDENLVALEAILSDLPNVDRGGAAPHVRLVKAHSGGAALRSILREDFALILLDVSMPGMDGFEVASLIKQRDRSKHIPIIFLTAELRDRDAAYRGYEVGAVDYLEKPLEPDVVRAKVAVFIELYRRGEKIQRQAEMLQEAERRRREIELAELRRAEEQRRQNLADAIPQIVFVVQPGGEVSYLNQRWAEYTGLSCAVSIGPAFPSVIHPSDVRRFLDQWQRTLEGVEPLRTECRLRSVQGGYRWHLCQMVPELDRDQKLVGWLGTFTDVDEQKRIEEERGQLLLREQAARAEAELSLRRSEFLAEASGLLASSLDAGGILRGLSNLAVERLASWCVIDLFDPQGEVVQVSFCHEDTSLSPLESELAERLRPDNSIHPKPAGARRSGRTEFYEGVDSPSRLAAVLGLAKPSVIDRLGATSYLSVPLRAREQVVGAMTLVSARIDRLYSSADLALAVDLGQRVALAVDNAHLYEGAQEAVRIREEFLSIASHELRTPLSALQLQVQSLQLQLRRTPIDPERLIPKVGVAQRQVERLTRLINELLDVSRIEAGRLELDREDVDLAELVRDVVSRFSGELERANSAVELSLQSGVVGHWDRLRLDQVVTNLLQNAIKYGRSRPIHVIVEALPDRARFCVRDQGIGISKSDLQRIFGRFERAVSSRAYGGMGVGLFIVDQILKAHEGSIEVESEPGVGSTFVVELPLSSDPRLPRPSRPVGSIVPAQTA